MKEPWPWSAARYAAHGMSVRKLMAGDVEAAAEVLSQAFVSDPFVMWNFEDRIATLLPTAFRATIGPLTNAGTTYGYFHAETLVGVALYQAPGFSIKVGPVLRSGPELAVHALGRTSLRMAHGFGETERFKQDCMGDKPYFYLDAVGVSPHVAGRGFGTRLIQESLRMVRGDRVEPCFLISQRHNLAYYQKRGFKSLRDRLLPRCNVRFYGMLEVRT
jgi:GNAT superfamily N-acetyltransferase